MMEERAKRRAQGLKTLPDVPDGAVPSLEAARAALEKFQAERMATLGSVSEPLARAQEQLAALEASLGRVNVQPPFYEREAYKRALKARTDMYSTDGLAQSGEPTIAVLVLHACLTQICSAGFCIDVM